MPRRRGTKESWDMVGIGKMLRAFSERGRGRNGSGVVAQKVNRAAAHRLPGDELGAGVGAGGEDWARPEYGRYMATSPSVYAAVKLRAEAVTRPPLRVYRVEESPSPRYTPARGEGASRRVPVEASHPVARLLERVNPWYTRTDLWRATEIYLCLWGSAFWAIERGEDGEPELWPLRPDRMAVIPDRRRHVRGFVYRGAPGALPSEQVAYTPDEIVWLRYFNPLEELAGLSPLAPARLSADMGHEGLHFNRHLLRNSARPDFLLLTNQEMNEAELEDFYARWEQRYQGPENARRPAVASAVRDVKTLGLSHRDIDFIQGLRWSLEEVSRAYGVPKLLLGDFERATYANVQASERMFWRNTVAPEVKFLEDQLNRSLLPKLGYPQLTVEFDLSAIEALQEDENSKVQRETALLDRGVLTINEVRRERNLPEVPWGDGPASE
ncbi:MAG: phage portal protein [Chloroflexi bacterium]|nr:phage portal protein [Chloroflexota bacterium]